MNKKSLSILFSSVLLATLIGCSGGGSATPSVSTESPADQGATTDQKPVEEPAATSLTAEDVVKKLQDAGLEAESPSKIAKNEVGPAPTIFTEGSRILVPSLGEDNGGRVFVFKNEADMETMKTYYDKMGESSGMFFSWTAGKGNVLLQMNGDMKEEEFDKYKEVIENL